jgi:hypothetical protein
MVAICNNNRPAEVLMSSATVENCSVCGSAKLHDIELWLKNSVTSVMKLLKGMHASTSYLMT